MEKIYNSEEIQAKWNTFWEKERSFQAKNDGSPTFTIFIPPPNVTGILHMGHTLNNTVQDILCRWARIQGKDVLWIPGTDHAGIATQARVEKELKKEGLIRQQLGREAFLERVKAWKDKHGHIIYEQLRTLGFSCDWSHKTYTLDPDYSRFVLSTFVELYNRGYIYRGKRLVNWCPVSQTALSDEEVIMKPTPAFLYIFNYRIKEKPNTTLSIATTRPETIMGDVALAVHPEDSRYQSLVGLHAQCPFDAQRTIPIIADAAVEREFGTGVLKITPAHDPIDFEVGQRHHLPFIEVLDAQGRVNEAGAPFQGLDRMEARKAVVEALQGKGLLVETKPYEHAVGYSERADVPIEPRLSEQWFVRYPKVEEAKAIAQKHLIKIWPQRWLKTYLHWLDNIQDWCISRQLWWGHRIPVWYHKQDPSRLHVSVDGPADPDNWEQDPDVLDTWFSSWLWPMGTLHYEKKTPEAQEFFNRYYPGNTLVSGPDILFFWITRMIIAALEFVEDRPLEQRIPFKNIYLTGIVRDARGRKMSKSLGNSPDPLDLVKKFGADGVRIGLLSIAPQGQDIRFDERFLTQGRNFCTKLWNACRFRHMQGSIQGYRSIEDYLQVLKQVELSLYDQHLLVMLLNTMGEYEKLLQRYEFCAAIKLLQQCFKNLFCDWYLEVQKQQKQQNLILQDLFLRQILLMLNPYAPYITEELWSHLALGPGLLHTAGWEMEKIRAWVQTNTAQAREKIESIEQLRQIVSQLRSLKAEHGLSAKRDTALTVVLEEKYTDFFHQHHPLLVALAGLKTLERIAETRSNTPNVVTLWGTFFLEQSASGALDRAAIEQEIAQLTRYIQDAEKKLANVQFTSHAPQSVIEGVERQKAENIQKRTALEQLLR